MRIDLKKQKPEEHSPENGKCIYPFIIRAEKNSSQNSYVRQRTVVRVLSGDNATQV
jgi:hypothetical protein